MNRQPIVHHRNARMIETVDSKRPPKWVFQCVICNTKTNLSLLDIGLNFFSEFLTGEMADKRVVH